MCPAGDYYTTEDVKEVYQRDMVTLRDQLREFFEQKPFPTKYLYFVTRLDFYKPDPSEDSDEESPAVPKDPVAAAATTSTGAAVTTETNAPKPTELDDYVSMYVAICGNGSVMVPMAVFPPVEPWHWERKKPVKLRHAHSMHRVKRHDPNEALQFFSVVRLP